MENIVCPEYRSPKYPETYGDLLDWAIARIERPGEKIFFRIGDRALTYSQFQEGTNRICNFLTDCGIRKGDHIAIFLASCLEYAYLYHALGKLGAVMCPINPFIKGEPLTYILAHSDSKYIITTKALYTEKISGKVSLLRDLRSVFFLDEKDHIKGVNTVLLSDASNYSASFESKSHVTGDDIQGIWYTSGTTGVPKGAVMNHKTYLYRILFDVEYFRMTVQDVSYYILPMYHVGYAIGGGPLALAAGAQIVQVPWFSASTFWSDVVRYGATMTFSTGTVIPILLNQPITDAEIAGRKKLRLWLGWPVDDPKRVQERWPGIKFIEAYGTTEVPLITIADFDNPEFGDAGPPTAYTKMKVVDPETGVEVSQGQVGEIVGGHKLGPDYILKEYYKDPEKTNQVIRDGYWYSGDLGLINEKGHLKFADRLKDYLRVGGENVSSAVVEGIIRKHPCVSEVAIVGRKGELGHDEVVAHIVAKDGMTVDPKDFFQYCNENMAYFMVPRYLILRSELPKTGTLRIEKYKLREEGLPANTMDRLALGISLNR